MNGIKFLASAFSALLMWLPSFAAKTLYVNNTVGNDDYDGLAAVYDGTHGPKLRIQAAIDAAESGDAVVVAPGVYGDEQGSVPASAAGQTVRVYIDKAITLRSSGGRESTFIVGKRGSAEDGTGEGAVTGLRVASTVATGSGDPVEIQGFTFRDCYSDVAKNGAYGGVIGWRASSGPVLADGTGPWVVDCTISNCTYHAYGALGRVNAARTLVSGNSSSAVGVNAAQCNLVHCALTGYSGQVGMNGTSKQYAINCTVSDGSHNPCSSSCMMYFLNTAFTALYSGACNCTAASNSVIQAAGKYGDFSDTGNFKGATYAHSQVAAPLLGDFRPLAAVEGLCSDASLCGAGDPKWLGLVPEKYRYTDMEGNAFVPDAAGKIAIGAVQTPMTPVTRFRVGNTSSGDTYAYIRVNGKRGSGTTVNYAGYFYLDGASWPRCYEITADVPEGKHLWAFRSTDKEEIRFPTKDGRILFVPAIDKTVTVTPILADKVYYVDDMNGDDNAYDGLSSVADGTVGPFQTIQKAIDTAANGNFVSIYVAPGLYNKGASPYSDYAAAPLCRVKAHWASSYFRIVATGSAEETVIAGAPDTTSEYRDANGNGPKAVRCIRFNPAAKCCVQGFTVTGGHTDSAAHTDTTTWKAGGAFMTDRGKLSWLMDCIVSNNFSAGSGAAMYYGSAARCRFIDNRVSASGYFAFVGNARLFGCTLEVTDDSLALLSSMSENVTVVNCSSRCPTASRLFPVSGHGFLFNNIVFNNQAMDGDETVCASGNVLDRTEYADSVLNAEGTAYVAADAGYLDSGNGDLRISSGSAAIGAGTAWTELSGGTRIPQAVAWTNYYSFLQHDFNGDGPFFTDGNPTAGAYQKPAKHLVTVSLNRPGDISVSYAETNLLDFGESLALSAKDGKRKVIGFDVNGEFIEGTSFSVDAPGQAAGGLTTVKVLANTNWYVDAVNGSDDDTGWTGDDAFLTLSNAVSVAIPGDVVVALPGTYSKGTMIQSEMAVGSAYSPVLRSRVIVPGGVSLVSRDGAEATVIKGECADPDVDNGLGEGSVRCVYMLEGARLSGFTVTGGSTLGEVDSATDNNSGAGIFCAEAPSTSPETLVTDCIISNNVSFVGGGGAYRGCVVLRCRFFDNGSCGEGGALANCCAYECLFDRNYGTYGVSQPYRLHGCTFGPETFNWNRTGNRCALRTDPVSAVWNVQNCLFLGGVRCPVRHAQNCIIPSDDFFYTNRDSSNWVDIVVAEVEVGDDYAPAFESAAANAANTGYARDVDFEGDVYGNPRRSNGGMDVGAVETDWRERYAAFLGSRVTVPEVSWEATATGSPGILLPEGSSLAAEWTYGVTGRGTAVVKFVVDDGAVLTIMREGKEPLTFGAGAGEYRFRDAREYESFAFSVAGGDAELLGIDRDMPLSIVIR